MEISKTLFEFRGNGFHGRFITQCLLACMAATPIFPPTKCNQKSQNLQ